MDFCKVSEADSRWNITAEEKALSDAWIVDISAEFRYTGEINGIASDDWCSDLYDENIGFLMYRKGSTFIMKPRYYNGSEDIASPETIKEYVKSTLLKAQELSHIVYFSGDEAKAAGCRNVYDIWYELPESFPYNSVEEIEAELLKYYTEDTVEAVHVEHWFSVINGKLCARTYDKGANVVTYHNLDDVDVLLQHGDDIWFSVPVINTKLYESYVEDVHMVLWLDDWKHIIMLF